MLGPRRWSSTGRAAAVSLRHFEENPHRLRSLPMARILVVADTPWVRNEVHAALTEPEFDLIDHAEPTTAADTIAEQNVDAVVVDLQVASMGGMAVTRAVKAASYLNGSSAVPVVILLDRAADGFLAKRAGASAWIAKPFGSHEIRTIMNDVLAGTDAGPKGASTAAEAE